MSDDRIEHADDDAVIGEGETTNEDERIVDVPVEDDQPLAEVDDGDDPSRYGIEEDLATRAPQERPDIGRTS